MRAVLVYARSDLRRRWLAWVGLALVAGLAAGCVIVLASGARRTDTAYPRFLRAEHAADAELFLTGSPSPEQVRRLPEVADSATALVLPPVNSGFGVTVVSDPRLGAQLNKFKFLAGRPFSPARADEAVVGFVLARDLHVRVGSALPLTVATGPNRVPRTVIVRLVGIEATPGEFPPRTSNNTLLSVYVPPAFLRGAEASRAPSVAGTAVAMFVRLHGGPRQTAAFEADLNRLSRGSAGVTEISSASSEVRNSMHFAAVALLLMAGFAALTAVLIVFELLSRRSVEDATEHQVLHTLGMTSRQLIAAAVLRVSVTGVSAAAVAVAISFAASPLLPRGTPHVAEPHPGFTFNAAGFGMGAAGVVLVLTLLGVVAAARATASAGSRTPVRANQAGVPPLGRLLSLVRLPLVIATGARMALQPGRGRAAVPVRATLVATAIGLGAMAAALTFGASLGHLISTPALYGGTFDADVTPYGDAASMNQLVAAVRADPSVASVALGETGIPFQVGHVQFSGFARQNVEGSVSPTVIDGRLPDASDEVLLGSRTLEDLHAHIGQTVPVTVAGVTIRPVPLRVVGRAVFAPIAGSAGLGRGAMVTIEALAAFARVAPPGFQPPPPGDVFVRFRPRTSNPRAVAELGQRVANEQGFVNVPSQPTDLANFGQVRDLPQLLAGLLGVVSLATIAYMLITAVRRRRHDLAVLKSLGFAPRQVSAAVACQAISIVLVGAIIGVPLGTAAGRAAWAAVATQLGVVVRPTVPLLLVLGLVPSAVLLANLVAVGPAVIAGRTRAAATLHSE